MTKDEIKENSVLLAKFLGWKKVDRFSHEWITPHYSNYIGVDGNMYDSSVFYPEDMKFHTSWDWLIPILQKILDITFSDEENETCDSDLFYDIRDCIPDINHTYKAIIEFVKQYNNGTFR